MRGLSPTLRAWAQGTASEFVLQSITANANVEIVQRTPRRYVCGDRLAGERRCPDCNLFARRVGEVCLI